MAKKIGFFTQIINQKRLNTRNKFDRSVILKPIARNERMYIENTINMNKKETLKIDCNNSKLKSLSIKTSRFSSGSGSCCGLCGYGLELI